MNFYYSTIFGLLFLLWGCFSLQAQDNPQEMLIDETWYLIKTEINGQEYPFVPNQELHQVILDFVTEPEAPEKFVFSPSLCEALEWEMSFMEENQFTVNLYSDLAYTHCTEPDNLYYDNFYYLGGFWSAQEEDLFTFSINESDDLLQLVIEGNEGNLAYYQNAPYLSVEENIFADLKVYPNPMDKMLYLDNLSEKAKLEIYSINGKLLLTQNLATENNQIDVSSLSTGLYFYRLEGVNNQFTTGKLIKK